jgi:dipeptidyl aminopeptidase/acylaminoacyl peptidase
LDISDPLFLESLRRHRDDPPPTIELVTPLVETEQYTQYQIAYLSDGLRITELMNMPKHQEDSDSRLPVILLNHGFYNPASYTPGTGTQREADYLARRGYVTIASDYRGYAGSEGDFGGHFDPGWTYDMLDLLDALPSLDFVDPERVGIWGHSTGGEIALRVIAARDNVDATVLFGSMGADAVDNFRLVQGWGGGHAVVQRYGTPEEAPEAWANLSPITYLADISSPISIHHGDLDGEVPPELSVRLWQAMQAANTSGEYYAYPDQRHIFQGEAWTLAMERTLAFFNQYVKNQ